MNRQEYRDLRQALACLRGYLAKTAPEAGPMQEVSATEAQETYLQTLALRVLRGLEKRLDGDRNAADNDVRHANILGLKAPKKKPARTEHGGEKPKPSRRPAGGGGNCGTGSHGFEPGNHCQRPGSGGQKPKPPRPSRFHVPEHGPGIDRKLAILHASEKAEVSVAAALAGRRVGKYDALRDKHEPPYDVHVPKAKSPTGRDEFVEVKYKSEGKKNALSVHADALLRKADHQAEEKGSGYHTVLVDVRDRSFGGSEAQHYQGHDLFYRRGTGAYSTANMHRVKDHAELKRLIAMPDHELPEKARGVMPVRTPELEAQPESEDWVFVLGSATALVGIRQWVAGLPADECPRLHELAATLATTNTMELGAELEAALEVIPPPASLRPILEGFLARIGVGDEEETVTIGEDFPQSEADRKACESALNADEETGG